MRKFYSARLYKAPSRKFCVRSKESAKICRALNIRTSIRISGRAIANSRNLDEANLLFIREEKFVAPAWKNPRGASF